MTMLKSYIECALWCSRDEDDNHLNEYYGPEDLAPEARRSMESDCNDFLALIAETKTDRSNWTDEQLGHDFWLTRNGHGAGFHDRPDEENGRALTNLADTFGASDLYEGDDGLLYVTP